MSKCLACVDTMRVLNKDASRQAEKVIKSQIVYQIVIYFEEIHNYLKCPGIKQSDTQLKRSIPNWIKKLGYLPNSLESLAVSLCVQHLSKKQWVLYKCLNVVSFNPKQR